MALLDTNVLIDLSRGARTETSRRATAVVLMRLRRGESIFTSRIAEAEFRVGPFRSSDPARELAKVEDVLLQCPILEFDGRAAATFAEIKAHLLDIGRPPGDMDVQIAAVALIHGQTLITRNAKHFADVPGLAVESY